MDRRHPARLIRHAAQRTCRRSMRTATAALETTMSRPSSLAGSHRVSLPISSQGAAKDCALSLTWSGRAAENSGHLKRQHRSRSQRRFPEDALVANVGCRRISPIAERPDQGRLTEPAADARPLGWGLLFMPLCRPSLVPCVPARPSKKRPFAIAYAALPGRTEPWLRGRRMVNSVNSPGSLSTSIAPPCCCVTTSQLIDNPSPVPSPVGLVVKNG